MYNVAGLEGGLVKVKFALPHCQSKGGAVRIRLGWKWQRIDLAMPCKRTFGSRLAGATLLTLLDHLLHWVSLPGLPRSTDHWEWHLTPVGMHQERAGNWLCRN